MLPGVNKLVWGSPRHVTEYWRTDALHCCQDVSAAVAALQAGSAAVARVTALCREVLLVQVERKRVYDLPDFQQRQAAHQVGRGGSPTACHSGQ